ncbi:MAG: hypothetical protein IKS33_06655 [Bacteroidales bacterium]|jgi:hypothetical protein|nr:hypothetical protein [Bacteroidales bacterium]MBQ4477689.1 hypothetical protein [Bacteroidales bacterium]MBR4453920.1 hypothetical protein [Bacteroidales bacterium]MCR5554495.1 hypothetical protein [Bacteroidales bacterium]
MGEKIDLICNQLTAKSNLKIATAQKSATAFELLKQETQKFPDIYKATNNNPEIVVSYESKQPQCFSLRYGSDVLFCHLHSNVFEFSRDHEVMKTPYIRENKDRSFCGMISIYNFLTDSVIYERLNDSGYLIGRVFINSEGHCYIDGKRELGQIYNNFSSTIFDETMAKTILEAALQYTINFDLLVPPYEMVQEMTIHEMMELNNKHALVKTAKRLGFRFQADTDL